MKLILKGDMNKNSPITTSCSSTRLIDDTIHTSNNVIINKHTIENAHVIADIYAGDSSYEYFKIKAFFTILSPTIIILFINGKARKQPLDFSDKEQMEKNKGRGWFGLNFTKEFLQKLNVKIAIYKPTKKCGESKVGELEILSAFGNDNWFQPQ